MTSGRPTAVLFDLDGVFFVGDRAIPGGVATLAFLQERSVPYRFVTNTTSQPREQLAAKLRGFGIGAEAEQILTPIVAAAELITEAGAEPVAAFLPSESAADLGVALLAPGSEEPVASVVIGDLGDDWDFARLNQAFRHLLQDPPPLFIALGRSRFWADHDGWKLDVGPFVAALEYATDRSAIVSGKSSESFFHAAAQLVDTPPGQVAMVGDDVRSDVLAAQQAGMIGVLVRTGKFTEADLARDAGPDHVLGSIADFPAWWRATSAAADVD